MNHLVKWDFLFVVKYLILIKRTKECQLNLEEKKTYL